MKQKKEKRITLRLTPEQYEAIQSKAETAQMSNMGKIQDVHLGETMEALGQIYRQLRELAEQEKR